MPRLSRSRLAALAAIVTLPVALVGSCGGDTLLVPAAPHGVYVLRSIEGVPLPRVPLATSNYEILADSLFLGAGGQGERHSVIRGLADDQTTRAVDYFTWEQDGDTLIIYGACVTLVVGGCDLMPVAMRGETHSGVYWITESFRMRTPAVYVRVQ